ncbi:MAG: type VI secretion system baseplate subunit TssF [SAR324 cluster bacterium]|nr:type VI secretion system baseplate subunit TssF [SAR324 cluster bacterium]
MFLDLYKDELKKLHETGEAFSNEHPVLAPLLNGTSNDPDVERLLEGTAFLTANINQKINDEFPEIVQSLMQIINPQYLRPVPAATIIKFTPKNNLSDTLHIPAGTYIDSIAVDGNTCRFKTCQDVDLLPLKITGFETEELKSDGITVDQMELKISFELYGTTLDNWQQKRLRFYLGGPFGNACDIYFLLQYFLKEINIVNKQTGVTSSLDRRQLIPVGFDPADALLPYPANLFPSYRILNEYFMFPEKFLFLDLALDQWSDRGTGNQFCVSFKCGIPPFVMPKINKDTFELFTVPAVNLFDHDATPVQLTHQEKEVLLSPSGMKPGTYQIYSVDQVSGLMRGTPGKRQFIPFTDFQLRQNAPVYQVVFRPSIRSSETDIFLSLAYPPGETLTDSEIMMARISCTNADLPAGLQAGDISKPTSNTPELATFKNLIPPTISHAPALYGNLLWKLLADLSINTNSLSTIESLTALLNHYIIQDNKDKPREIANLRRVNSMYEMTVTPEERLFKRDVYRGQSIHIKTRSDQFASLGDMFLFGSILDYFFATYASFNTYTALTFEDTAKWETIQWPPRLGTRPIL